jgi:hypothetical protein
MTTPSLSMWTVYDHPTDWPNAYIARQYRILDSGAYVATENVIIAQDLDIIRRAMIEEFGLTCLTRNEGDDVKIIETWV